MEINIRLKTSGSNIIRSTLRIIVNCPNSLRRASVTRSLVDFDGRSIVTDSKITSMVSLADTALLIVFLEVCGLLFTSIWTIYKPSQSEEVKHDNVLSCGSQEIEVLTKSKCHQRMLDLRLRLGCIYHGLEALEQCPGRHISRRQQLTRIEQCYIRFGVHDPTQIRQATPGHAACLAPTWHISRGHKTTQRVVYLRRGNNTPVKVASGSASPENRLDMMC